MSKHDTVRDAYDNGNGQSVQVLDCGEWTDCGSGFGQIEPRWHEDKQYRIKPMEHSQASNTAILLVNKLQPHNPGQSIIKLLNYIGDLEQENNSLKSAASLNDDISEGRRRKIIELKNDIEGLYQDTLIQKRGIKELTF